MDTLTSANEEILIEKRIVITGFRAVYTAATEKAIWAVKIFPSRTNPRILIKIDVLVTKLSKEKIVPSR